LRYQALSARDPRFDGVFFVGVTSTASTAGRSVRRRRPKEVNCRFFNYPQEAEQQRFRPCLRCRPELAPGNAPGGCLAAHRAHDPATARRGLDRERRRTGGNRNTVNLSSRQIRRIVQKELGVSPIQLLLTRRLLLAKQLLTETRLPVTQIAFASGSLGPAALQRCLQFPLRPGAHGLAQEGLDGLAQPGGGETSTLQPHVSTAL
jgi:AraC family transcriptional regulator of adaptative response / DNA-3-methyladenine glycosylase II